jgi:glycosyltransferase involved in cell wall biosynthesis
MAIREEGIGWVVEPGDVESTVRTIQCARDSWQLLSRMGASARMAAETRYSPDIILQKFDEYFAPLDREFMGFSL